MNILYLSYTGLAEPLGVSQVLAYLTRLARSHRITLITLEKDPDLADHALISERRAACEAAGIRWVPLRYHRRPRLLATGWNLATLAATASREASGNNADLIHARGYIPAFVAMFVAALTRRPFIFDTRAFWPEEVIAAGRLRRGSLVHRLIVAAERLAMRRAAGIVYLTWAAAEYVRAHHPELGAEKDIVVIPTCADLERYVPRPRAPAPLHVVSIGSVLSGWFKPDRLFASFAAIRRAVPDARFSIFSRDDARELRQEAAAAGLDPDALTVDALAPEQVPAALATAHVVPMFYKTGLARMAGFPTRMAEALGCGVPVLCNADGGDAARITRENRVGVMVDDDSEEAMTRAIPELLELLADPGLAKRCRATAERLFSVEGGARDYDALYRRIDHRQGSRSR